MVKLLGRRPQIRQLQEALGSKKAELLAVIGRRRVGKTYLIREIYREHIALEITGLLYGKKSDQLKNFFSSMRAHRLIDDDQTGTKDWLSAFQLLSQQLEALNKKEKYVIFIDELPWIATKRSNFIMGLSWFWNSWAVKQNIVVVICGSATSWMIKKVINNRGGLHNRITDILHLAPFTLNETEAFLQAKGINYPRYQQLQLYMSIGGIPLYLDKIKGNLSAIENINAICFQKSGFLFNEFERLFPALFDNSANHIAIIRALASKRIGMTRGEIAKKSKLPVGGTFTKYINELHESGFIDTYTGLGKRRKDTLYRLIDFYSLFYLSFIEPNIGVKNVDFNLMASMPAYKSWAGYTFESVCLTHVKQLIKALGISGIHSTTHSFIAKPKDGLPGTQVDLVIDRSDNAIHLCEIKFSDRAIALNKSDSDNIRQKKTVFAYHTKSKKHIFITYITTHGLIKNQWKFGSVDQEIEMDVLFEANDS